MSTTADDDDDDDDDDDHHHHHHKNDNTLLSLKGNLLWNMPSVSHANEQNCSGKQKEKGYKFQL